MNESRLYRKCGGWGSYQNFVDAIGVAFWEWSVDGKRDAVGKNRDENEPFERSARACQENVNK